MLTLCAFSGLLWCHASCDADLATCILCPAFAVLRAGSPSGAAIPWMVTGATAAPGMAASRMAGPMAAHPAAYAGYQQAAMAQRAAMAAQQQLQHRMMMAAQGATTAAAAMQYGGPAAAGGAAALGSPRSPYNAASTAAQMMGSGGPIGLAPMGSPMPWLPYMQQAQQWAGVAPGYMAYQRPQYAAAMQGVSPVQLASPTPSNGSGVSLAVARQHGCSSQERAEGERGSAAAAGGMSESGAGPARAGSSGGSSGDERQLGDGTGHRHEDAALPPVVTAAKNTAVAAAACGGRGSPAAGATPRGVVACTPNGNQSLATVSEAGSSRASTQRNSHDYPGVAAYAFASPRVLAAAAEPGIGSQAPRLQPGVSSADVSAALEASASAELRGGDTGSRTQAVGTAAAPANPAAEGPGEWRGAPDFPGLNGAAKEAWCG